jgi:hypothetical protein
MSIESDGGDAVAPARLPPGDDIASAEARGHGMETLSAGDYCRLAEECFVLAAATKDPEAAAELIKTGDDYLRCAAGCLADQLQSDAK